MAELTIKDIARLCGCGVSTVSRAMNNHPDINPETKQKILDVIEAHNYIPNNSARNLKRTESNTIGILMKGIDNPFFLAMFEIFESALSKESYSFVLQRVQDSEDEVSVAAELVKEKRLKGIIFLGGFVERTEESLEQLGIPYVFCTVVPQDVKEFEGGGFVAIDDEAESYKVVDYLCKLGHKKIAMVCSARGDKGIARMRTKGYQRALEDNGVAFEPNLLRHMRADIKPFSAENGYAVTKELLESGEEFTAIVALSDMVAIGASKALLMAGKRIPEDVSVAGFDGIDTAKYYHPSLTTLRQPKEEMAAAAIHMLIGMIDGQNIKRRLQLFPGELQIRESTCALKD